MPNEVEAPGHYLRFFSCPAGMDKPEEGAIKNPSELSAYIGQKLSKVGEIRFVNSSQVVSFMGAISELTSNQSIFSLLQGPVFGYEPSEEAHDFGGLNHQEANELYEELQLAMSDDDTPNEAEMESESKTDEAAAESDVMEEDDDDEIAHVALKYGMEPDQFSGTLAAVAAMLKKCLENGGRPLTTNEKF